MKKVVAITGGIGSGKSAVLRIIGGLGYPIISADDVNRELLSDTRYLDLLRKNFNEAFPDGVFEKKILSSIIFNDENKRILLNSIAHRRIRALVETKITSIDSELIFVEVPLLVESGMMDMFDAVIVVTSDIDIKIERVMHRDNISREDVIKRMNSQLDDVELLKIATYVIDNSGTLDELNEATRSVIAKIIEQE